MKEISNRIVIYGTGFIAKKVQTIVSEFYKNQVEIVAFTSSYEQNSMHVKYINRDEISNDIADKVVVAINSLTEYNNVVNYYKKSKTLDVNNLVYWEEFVNELRKQAILKKYINNNDPCIINTLKWLQENKLTVRNQYENKEKTLYELFEDKETELFYVDFYGNRMYFPKNICYLEFDGKKWMENVVENDQYPLSPHLYTYEGHNIRKNGVIVDAGVAEGNFTLAHINDTRKAYLFEYDEQWLKALSYTFKPFKEKIIIIPKKLGDIDSLDTITLDTAVKEKVDFVKMDIEGAEVKTVLGGIKLLDESNANLSICTYHRQNDAKYLDFILNKLGYKTSYSNGKMFFCYDDNIDFSLDFRNGIIYGEKR